MPIAQNDVNLLAVETNDQDFAAGSNINFQVRAEVGGALHGTGGKYQVRLTMTDTTNPALVDTQDITGNYGDANWPNAGLNVFSFTVPGAATAGRVGDILEPQARLIGNAAAPFDASHVVGETILVTP
ncbi:MAG TPA: hypothetical protein VFR23_24285 [Jiangellaceae bacterium]|nr:hypothetical protein [Jiangellaceae bacterium]